MELKWHAPQIPDRNVCWRWKTSLVLALTDGVWSFGSCLHPFQKYKMEESFDFFSLWNQMLSHQAGGEGDTVRRETSDASGGRDWKCTRAIDHDSYNYKRKMDWDWNPLSSSAQKKKEKRKDSWTAKPALKATLNLLVNFKEPVMLETLTEKSKGVFFDGGSLKCWFVVFFSRSIRKQHL